MNCKKYENLMIEYLDQSLSQTRTEEVNRHLQHCETCSRTFSQHQQFATSFKHTMTQQTSHLRFTPSFDPETVATEASPTPRASGRRAPLSGWFGLQLKPAFAILIVGFIVGFLVNAFLGTNGTPSSPADPGADIQTAAHVRQVVREHLEDVKPVLIEYTACSLMPDEKEDLLPDKEMVTRLLIQNRLLKKRLPTDKKERLRQLLDELELILTEISNLTDGADDACTPIKQLIKEKEILFKLEVVDSKFDEAAVI